MKALVVQFDLASDDYSRLLDAFVASWKENATIPIEIHSIAPPMMGDRNYPYIANTRKLEVWRENFTEDTIFVDCDMLCLKCPSAGFEGIENIGICKRSNTAPFNGGVIYARYTDYSKRFFDKLLEVNDKMLSYKGFHSKWRKKYAGINQAAMGYLFENGFEYEEVPEMYNLCPPFEEWKHASMIHIKLNHLRNMCLHGDSGPKPLEEVSELWRSYAD